VITPVDPTIPGGSMELPSIGTVARALSTVPDAQLGLTNKVVLNPNRNINDAYWAVKYGRPDFFSAGSASGGTLNLYPMPPSNASSQAFIDSTVIHETGHLLSEKLWSNPNAKSAWESAITADARRPSTYSARAPTEDFSESLVMYTLSKGTPGEVAARKLFPNRDNILDSVFK
jgi:type VI secretion system secreted protein VgrG